MSNYALDAPLLDSLEPWYRRILDYQAIMATEDEQLELLAEELSAVRDNLFFRSMDLGAVSAWEQIMSIVPNPAVESLEFRRLRLLNRISMRPPYTLGFLYQKLDEIIGPGAWDVRVDYPNYTVYIESEAENQNWAGELEHTLNTVKPAHIVYVNVPRVTSGLLLSEQIGLTERTYLYRLGAWGLGLEPFAAEENKGVIKMPSTPSVTASLLDRTAAFVKEDVVSARINGAIAITSLEKSVTGSVLTVTYHVTPNLTEEITQAELLDSEGVPLTSSAVYVKVSQPVIMTHRIPIKEGVPSNG